MARKTKDDVYAGADSNVIREAQAVPGEHEPAGTEHRRRHLPRSGVEGPGSERSPLSGTAHTVSRGDEVGTKGATEGGSHSYPDGTHPNLRDLNPQWDKPPHRGRGK